MQTDVSGSHEREIPAVEMSTVMYNNEFDPGWCQRNMDGMGDMRQSSWESKISVVEGCPEKFLWIEIEATELVKVIRQKVWDRKSIEGISFLLEQPQNTATFCREAISRTSLTSDGHFSRPPISFRK